MPYVITPQGKNLGLIRDRSLLAYYRGEGYEITREPPAEAPADEPAEAPVETPTRKPTAKRRSESQTSDAEEPSRSSEETAE